MLVEESINPYVSYVNLNYAIIIQKSSQKLLVAEYTNLYEFLATLVMYDPNNDFLIYRTQIVPPTQDEIENIYDSIFSNR